MVYFLSTVPKIAVLVFLMRAFVMLYSGLPMTLIMLSIKLIFVICGMLSILVGALGALYQVKIKRMFAFSAIANMGYIILGLTCGSTLGYMSVFFYILIYSLNLISIFTCLVILRNKEDFLEIKNVVEFASSAHHNYLLTLILALNLFALAGVPPLSGFYPNDLYL